MSHYIMLYYKCMYVYVYVYVCVYIYIYMPAAGGARAPLRADWPATEKEVAVCLTNNGY